MTDSNTTFKRFSVDTHEMNNPPPPPYPTLPDVTTTQSMQQQQQQQPGMTQHLREVRKNIQHRWSAGSPTGAAPGTHPEEQHLLSADAQDTPPGCGGGSPVPAVRASFHAAATSLNPPPPSTAQLQMVINDALLREQQQSKVLSTTTMTATSSYSVSAAAAPPARQETIC